MRFLSIFLVFLLWLPAGAAILAWDASSGATGYRLYYGTNSGQYAWNVNVGTNLTATVIGLTSGRTYFFGVTAYNSTAESAFSTEIEYTQPSLGVLTVDFARDISGPWTNVVTITNIMDGGAGFWRVNLTNISF